MAETEAPVDPRLVALGLATEVVIEFPEGTIEVDMLADTAPAAPAAVPAPEAVLAPPIAPERPPTAPEWSPEAPDPRLALVERLPAMPPAIPARPPVASPRSVAPPPLAPPPSFAPPTPTPVVSAERTAVRLEPTPVEPEALPESPVLIQTSVVHGLWPRRADLSLEELGFRIDGTRPVAARWSDVTSIDVKRERVSVRTKTGTTRLALAIDGVAAPELNDALARVMSEARDGTLDLQGTAVHELQNAMDSVRDTFHASDDEFIPLALGGALTVLTVILAFAVPEVLAFLTRPVVPANAFVLGSRLAPIDPRVLLVAAAAAAVATGVTARAALGKHAASWARGTLRGWHIERQSIVVRLRRGVALVFLYPAVAGAALAVALLIALPSARSHATVEPSGIHVVRPLPFFDRTASWSDVKEIVTLAASGSDHPHGLAALIRFNDEGTLSTIDLQVRNSTDRYFLELTRKWYAQAVDVRH